MSSIKSRLLSQEDQCLVLQPSLVKILGKSETLFLQQVHYCLTQPNLGKEIKGVKWIYNSLNSWVQKIKILSERTIKRCVSKLKKLGVLLVDTLSFRKQDRTNWYSINYERIETIKNDLSKENEQNSVNLTENSYEAILAPSLGQNGLLYNTKKTNREYINPYKSNKSQSDLKNENLIKTKLCNDIQEDLKTNDESFLNNSKYSSQKYLILEQKEEKTPNNTLSSSVTAKDLIEIWNQETNETTRITKDRAQKLNAAFKIFFNRSLKEWKAYCQSLMTSDFLTGKTYHKFKATLDWALNFKTIQKVKENSYGIMWSNRKSIDFHYTEEEIFNQAHKDPKEFKIRLLLLKNFGKKTYFSWFKDIKIIFKENKIIFVVTNSFVSNYIKTHYLRILEENLGIPFYAIPQTEYV